MLFTLGAFRVHSAMFVTHPTAMKRMKVKRRPNIDTPQPMNVSTCRAFSFSGLLFERKKIEMKEPTHTHTQKGSNI